VENSSQIKKVYTPHPDPCLPNRQALPQGERGLPSLDVSG